MNKKETGQNIDEDQTQKRKKSKVHLNTLFNIILLAGLVVLYVLYFTDFEKEPDIEVKGIEAIEKTVSDAALQIGFVDSDELLERYEFAQKMRDEMLAEQRRLESELNRRQRNFQNKVEEFQHQIQRGLISMEEAQVKEQELMQEQQELIMLSEEYSERLHEKEMDFNIELFDSIASFMNRYNDEMGYDFVLNYSPGGGLLFGGEQYDITEDFIEKINKETGEGH